MFFMLAILSNIEMDKRLHEKDNECYEGNYNKYGFHFTIYNAENIIPPLPIIISSRQI